VENSVAPDRCTCNDIEAEMHKVAKSRIDASPRSYRGISDKDTVIDDKIVFCPGCGGVENSVAPDRCTCNDIEAKVRALKVGDTFNVVGAQKDTLATVIAIDEYGIKAFYDGGIHDCPFKIALNKTDSEELADLSMKNLSEMLEANDPELAEYVAGDFWMSLPWDDEGETFAREHILKNYSDLIDRIEKATGEPFRKFLAMSEEEYEAYFADPNQQ
jgi:hypothetical protein